MIVLDFFVLTALISIRSLSNSKKLIEILLDLGFSILVHGSNYVMIAKLSVHKKSIQLQSEQWGCDKPVRRVKATSPTFGECIVLFFLDMGKIRTLLVFGKSLRTCEALRIWSQHHGIEYFWQNTRVVFCMN